MGTVGIVGMVVDLPLGLQQKARALQFWTRSPDSRSKGRFGNCIFFTPDTFGGLSVSDCEALYRSSKADISQPLCGGPAALYCWGHKQAERARRWRDRARPVASPCLPWRGRRLL